MKLTLKNLGWMAAALLCTSLFAGAASQAEVAQEPATQGAGEWDKETVRLFGSLPVQEGGRVKPLSTLAGFKLLKFNGKRKLVTPSGQKLDATAWLMDCLFFPEVAATYECFRVQNDEVLTAIGLHIEGKKKRDYYSLEALRPNADQLMAKAREWAHISPQEMDPVQRQLVALARNVTEFTDLAHEFDFTTLRFTAGDGPELKKILGASDVTLGTLLGKVGEIRDLALRLGREGNEQDPDRIAALAVFERLDAAQGAARLALLAPEVPVERETQWRSATDLITLSFRAEQPVAESIRLVSLLEQLERNHKQPAAFAATLKELHAGAATLAENRNEYWKVPLEQKFYKGDFFYYALILYMLGFLFAAFGWLKPSSVWLQRGVWASLLGGTVLASVGITLRCIIRSRPPVSTLYETILFIAVVGVIVAIVIEYINRQRLALVLATVLGAVGMWLSGKYEFKEAASAGDTMPSLVAVLDTNFWLSTHVTTVTMGYAAGLLAALIAHVWVFGKMFGMKRNDSAFYKHITRMVYGVLCFGLLFSVVGTILGGIWANYSWGRFWGWDPKENGALLICLWELLILHLRMGGYIKDRGLCNMAIIGGCVVAFSWWGVNLLGIGLHSYGFTSGIFRALAIFMVIEFLIVGASVIFGLAERNVGKPSAGSLSSEGTAE